jgi:hypothetical protein
VALQECARRKQLFRLLYLLAALVTQPGLRPALACETEPASSPEDRQAETRIGGVFRLRQESLHGYLGSRYGTGQSDGFLLARLRVHLEHERPTLGLFWAEFQDARAFGLPFDDVSFQGRNHPYRDTIDLNQFYWEKRHPDGWWWRVGRQSLSFADRRLFGPGDWGNTGRYVWDAAQGGVTAGGLHTTLILGRPVLHEPDHWPNRPSSSPTAFLAWSRVMAVPGELAGFYLRRTDSSDPAGRTSHSFGYSLDQQQHSWSARSLLAVQRGSRASEAVRAWGWMGAFAWKFQDAWHTAIETQQVTGSGDSDPTDTKDETFDGLFSGADTVLYGWMNLCFWRNLEEYRISILTRPVSGMTLRMEYHAFRLREAKDAWYGPGGPIRHDPGGTSGRDLGQEVDLVAKIVARGGLEILGGGGWFFPGTFIDRTGPASRGGWLFIQCSLPFSYVFE